MPLNTPTQSAKKELSPIAKRAILGLIIFLSLTALVVWVATGFGFSGKNDGAASIKEGAQEISQIIQDQTAIYKKNKKELNDNLNKQLKSQALLMPDNLIDPDEQPASVLYLNSRYQEKGVVAELQKVELYSKTTAAYFTVSLDSKRPDIFLYAALGSVLSQKPSVTAPNITYQPIFQDGTPAKLKSDKPLDVLVLFYPIDPTQKFDLILGDFLTNEDPNLAEHFAAHFSIDPAQIISAPNKGISTTPSNQGLDNR